MRSNSKQQIIESLATFDEATLSLALSYAFNIQKYGIDITEKLQTATAQCAALSTARLVGYEEAMERISERIGF